ncbi:MAG: hypothetical protein HZC37_29105 [Burkholderiales bacterium]|nr:hypothetical protein [Burkholderiales bacterium]
MRTSATLAITLLAGFALPAAASCPLAAEKAGERQITQGTLQVSWRAEPEALAVGRPFALTLQLCPPAARLLRVDATMPEHHHGMNYRPSVRPLGDGRWRAEGLLWHMAGRWELAIEVESGGERTWLRQSVHLP